MREPDRYDIERTDYEEFEMVRQPLGDYVLFDRWQEVADELTDLQIKYDDLVKALGELYKEA